jgi:hypothetical protein
VALNQHRRRRGLLREPLRYGEAHDAAADDL